MAKVDNSRGVQAKVVGRRASLRNDRSGRYFVANRTDAAEETIGALRSGLGVSGVTGGQFSFIDAMEHIIAEIGPADVCITAWATGIYDTGRLRQLVDRKRCKSVRFLIDRAPFESSPKFAGRLIDLFGADAIHSKIGIVKGERLGAVYRTSAGFNKNLRIEQFDLDVSDEYVQFFGRWFDEVWDASGRGLDNAGIMRDVFDRYLQAPATKEDEELAIAADDGLIRQAPTENRAKSKKARKQGDFTMSLADFNALIGD